MDGRKNEGYTTACRLIRLEELRSQRWRFVLLFGGRFLHVYHTSCHTAMADSFLRPHVRSSPKRNDGWFRARYSYIHR